MPVRFAFQVLVTVAPAGSVSPTFQPLVPAAPAVTLTVATKPPVQALTDTEAVHPPPGTGELGVGELGTGPLGEGELGEGELGEGELELGGVDVRTGVCQSRHSARFPAARLEIRNVPAADPVRSRNFWMCCCSGVRHSARLAQWLPSWTSDQ